jgi:hypothetical protein
MQLPEELEEMHRQLNSPHLVNGEWYRRNKAQYELVCYINNLIGLTLSECWESVPLFIERANIFLSEAPESYLTPEYRAYVQRYLQVLGEFVASIQNAPNKSFKADGVPPRP